MYLQQLYQHSKGWFILIVLFIILQIINNIRQDIAFSPIFQYGMFSEYIPMIDTLDVFEVYVNGKNLQAKDFSIQQWDKITLPLRYYANSGCNNTDIYQNDAKRLLQKISILANESNFIFPFNKVEFLKWYQPYLSSIINKKTGSIQVNYSIYKFDSGFHKIQSRPFYSLCK